MNELISVIVPIHNAEKYLQSCIDSIIKQTYKELEIILVNDCSDDDSGKICDTYAQDDKRIKVIHRETKGGEGGAVARNHGISEATGEIFYFIDSDDYIESDMLANMYEIMCREKSQCVVSSFHYVDAEENELNWRTPILSKYQCMSGKEAASVYLTSLDIEGFSWNKLIRKELLEEHGICFDESLNSFVDMYAMFKVIFYSNKVSFYDAKPYYYRQHNVSCVHTMTHRKLNNFKKVIGQIAELAKSNGLNKESDYFVSYRMVLQLFDAVKSKERYSDEVWKQIKSDFKWADIFAKSLWQMHQTLFSYCEENKAKNAVKLLIVWINFR